MEVTQLEIKKRFIVDGFKISREELNDGWSMPYGHCHEAYEIYLLENGERTVTIGNTEYIAAAHDVTLFPTNTPHKSSGTVPFCGICIHFSERYLDLHFTSESKRQLMKCFQFNLISLDEKGFNYIKKASQGFTPEASDNFLTLANILNILLKNTTTITDLPNKKTKIVITKAQLILDYVNENYFYIKRISDITELFNVSENYIFKVLRNEYGVTPKQYVNTLRIKYACHRLRYADASIKTIALDSGYNSYEHFSSVFKKLMQVTPTEYRSKAKSKH